MTNTSNPPVPRALSDHDVQRAVLEELEWMPGLEIAHIGVVVEDGGVTLFGEVPSAAERIAARKAVLRVRGVRTVADEVRIAGADWRLTTDSDIAEALARALRDASVVPTGAVQATVEEGAVTLSGEVQWQYQREAARKLAETLVGVREVDSRITLSRRPSAEDAAERIRGAIRRSALLDAASIEVTTNETVAVLTGTVHSFAERRQAEKAAWASPHVTDVRNEIVVVP
jgi:osmotically-inducible protein OsmY